MFLLLLLPPPKSTLFPYTTLFRSAVLILLIVIGSRGLRDFDAALIGYAVGSVFALAALVYRYTLWRSEEHTSELQSLRHLVCRLLLEKKKKSKTTYLIQK